MRCAYYPGCSLHATARAYDESTRRVAPLIGLRLQELDDWNCCGALACADVDELLGLSLATRNLALAARAKASTVVTPCGACFANLRKAEACRERFPALATKVDTALAEAKLRYEGGVTTKHLLEVIVRDIGLERVRRRVVRPLGGLRVAPYYGCQILRPHSAEDNPHAPIMLDQLIETLGAVAAPFALETACCGGTLMSSQQDIALRLCHNLLLAARRGAADCIAVTCPLCQINLDAFQRRVNEVHGTDFAIPIVFFTQLMGLAFGLLPTEVGLQRSIVPADRLSALVTGEVTP